MLHIPGEDTLEKVERLNAGKIAPGPGDLV